MASLLVAATVALPESAFGQATTQGGVTLRTYVAMGDSFTAGPLVPSPTGQPIDCGRSDSNYPSLVAAALEAAAFRDVSCAGARTDHFAQAQDGLVLGGANPPQYDALGGDVGLVTVGIGGNDIGFGEIAQRCFRPPPPLGQPCSAFYTEGGRDVLSERIAETAPKIAAALQEIRRRAPPAIVVVVTYPAIVPHSGDGCYPYVPVLPQDVPYLRAKQEELNAMLERQAEANGAHVANTYTPSAGHDACRPPGVAWVNGIVVAPPSFPAHPNAIGMEGMAAVVSDALRRVGFAWPTTTSGERGASVQAATAVAAGDAPMLPATGGGRPSVPIGVALATLGLYVFARLRRTPPQRR